MVDIDVSANEIGARIAPVPVGVARPFWSVMIPSYNSTELLADTLRCVLDRGQPRHILSRGREGALQGLSEWRTRKPNCSS